MTVEPVHTVGVDLGGTYARAALVDSAGKVVASARTTLTDRAPDAVVEAIAVAVDSALAAAPKVAVGGCGVGAAGQLLGETGHMVVGPNLGWRDVPLGAMLEARLRRKVRVVNDLSAAAWGELQVGAARGESEVFVVFVGSGVGSAIIANGRLVNGASGVAGEFGHIKVVPFGRRCGCGERGCLEAYVGGHNLIAQMREAISAGRGAALSALVGGELALLTAQVLERAVLAGDPTAKEIYEPAVGHLALAVANQVTVLNPSRLILGGGVLNHCPGMRDAVVAGVKAHSAIVSREAVRISSATLGDDAGIIGAALLASDLPT